MYVFGFSQRHFAISAFFQSKLIIGLDAWSDRSRQAADQSAEFVWIHRNCHAAAAQAGASVTHVDASKKVIGWARENQRFHV
jgi:hypothetical protein